MVLVERAGYGVDRGSLIRDARRAAGELGVRVVDVRVATHHVEYDLMAESRDRIEALLPKLGNIKEARFLDEETGWNPYIMAKQLFNQERFWEFHELLEDVWRRASGREKQALNGLILVAAAFVHLQRGDEESFFRVLGRALDRLRGFGGEVLGIKVGEVRERVKEILREGRPKVFKIQ